MHGRGERCEQGFGGKAQRKKPFGRPRRRWEDGLKLDIGDIGRGGWRWRGFTWLGIETVGGVS
jgi:hypothetical protein